jgi:hypothetical protein
MKKTPLFGLGMLGVLCFVISTIWAGRQVPGYSHISQLISESYAIDTPFGPYFRFLGFLPSGIFIAIFSFLAIGKLPNALATKIGFWGLGIFYGLGTVVVSIFPCDHGCNPELIDPSLSQVIHNLTGVPDLSDCTDQRIIARNCCPKMAQCQISILCGPSLWADCLCFCWHHLG